MQLEVIMPCHKLPNGKWKLGQKGGTFDDKAA